VRADLGAPVVIPVVGRVVNFVRYALKISVGADWLGVQVTRPREVLS